MPDNFYNSTDTAAHIKSTYHEWYFNPRWMCPEKCLTTDRAGSMHCWLKLRGHEHCLLHQENVDETVAMTCKRPCLSKIQFFCPTWHGWHIEYWGSVIKRDGNDINKELKCKNHFVMYRTRTFFDLLLILPLLMSQIDPQTLPHVRCTKWGFCGCCI